MKKLIIIELVVLLLCADLWAHNSDTLRTVSMEGVVVKASRSLRDIGVQKSSLGSQILTDNIASSMAEVLAQNSTIFIKSSGRATTATASLRGTAPSHTAVSWNGLNLSSPMLGMVDFSTIPSYFVDGGEVYHGATSVGVTGGGLGGAVVLSTAKSNREGLDVQLLGGVASYNTHDDFVRVSYTTKKWGSSTRILWSSSDNDFEYVNRDKFGHPTERNKNCDYADFHLLQEFFYNTPSAGRFSVKGWWMDSSRGIPRMTVDFRDDDLTKAWQDEQSFRGVAEWANSYGGVRLNARAGYNHDDLHYRHQVGLGDGKVTQSVDARSVATTAFAELNGEWSIGNNLMLAGNLKGNIYGVESEDVAPLTPVGYKATREEISAFASARWKPVEWFGLALNVREEWRDGAWSPLIPALFADVTIWPEVGLIVSGSAARNYRYPTLNDLYYVPGGNPDLLPEEGETFDLGVESSVERRGFKVGGKVTVYTSHINNWILWTPTVKGFWTPQNLQYVVSRGVEARANAEVQLSKDWKVDGRAIVGYTSSVNATEGSATYGNQLPYIPRWSATSALGIYWKRWSVNYKWQLYSDRYTNYSGTHFSGDVVEGYSLSNISLGHCFKVKNKVDFKVIFDINNLFNREYQSILSRPMPPRNYGLRIECRFGA